MKRGRKNIQSYKRIIKKGFGPIDTTPYRWSDKVKKEVERRIERVLGLREIYNIGPIDGDKRKQRSDGGGWKRYKKTQKEYRKRQREKRKEERRDDYASEERKRDAG